jgi:hypothetical protein
MSVPSDTSRRMTDSDLTIAVLQGIREDLQRSNRESAERFDSARAEQASARAESNQRFEVIETALRDIAAQLAMLSCELKAADLLVDQGS